MQTDVWRPGFWADLFGVEFSVVRTARLWVASLAVGLMVDLLFWEAIPPGISFPLFVAAALTIGSAFALDKGIRPAPDAIPLAALALVLAMVPVFRREPLTQLLGYLGAFGFAALYVHTYRHGGWTRYRIIDHSARLGSDLLGAGAQAADLRPHESLPAS